MNAHTQFTQDFNSLRGYLRNFALKLTKDSGLADDLVQDTALNAFKHQDKFQANSNMKAWLSTIMRNRFINQYRRKKNRTHIQDYTNEEYYLNSGNHQIYNEGEMNVRVQELNRVIESLDDIYRVPFMMYYHGFQYEEIQATLEVPMGTVKSRIFHARRILKKKLSRLNRELASSN